MKDTEIIELYWNRDESAISATADVYGNYCYSIAYHILQCNEDAQECVNDTYLKTWNAIPPHRPKILSTFLGKITRNLSFDR
jgi:RNA polymerase sigma-70 factor (ECF subfamily)